MATVLEESDTIGRGSRPPATPGSGVRGPDARAAALDRIVAGVNANLELGAVFEDVLDASQDLFGADVAGLWLLEPGSHPFRLAALRGADIGVVEGATRAAADLPVLGERVMREQQPIVLDQDDLGPELLAVYRSEGLRTVAIAPLQFREEPVGMLALGHRTPYDWNPHELALYTAFVNQIASAVVNGRLYGSVRDGAARLRAIQELSSRLSRIQNVEGIGAAIVAEADQLIEHDSIRVYRVDHDTRMCEPVAFQGEFAGIDNPPPEMLRLAVGEGLTGWVALHNLTIRLGDAYADPRARHIGESLGSMSMMLVPMTYEERVLGVIVVSKSGYDRYSEDDQRTLEIFAGYAAQALVNAEAFAQVHRQRQELHRRLESQRRLLEVNERLMATLDPGGVLEMIADSLKTVVSYDALTIYRVDHVAAVRRAVVARDSFAEAILSHESPLDAGITGWVVHNREAVLANDAHLDPRSMHIPGTPEEPESMIVCPLVLAGDVIGTLNLSRMGEDDAHFTQDEFELVQLFAGQASIALRNAEAHGAVVTRAERDALTGLRNHGAFQREIGEWVEVGAPFVLLMLDLDSFKSYNDAHGHPAGDTLLARIGLAMRDAIRADDRVYRYGGDEFAILLTGMPVAEAREVAERVRASVALLTAGDGPLVTVTVGLARFPDDGATKDDMVAAADRALYLAKPTDIGRGASNDPTRDLFLAAVDETTYRLLERLEPSQLLRAIVERAAGMVGVEHGYLYLLEDDGRGSAELVARVGIGAFEPHVGYRLPPGTGLGWAVVHSGLPQVVDDYDAYAERAPDLELGSFGAVCAVPLTSGDEVLGVIGLASGIPARPFSARESAAVTRFAQLASVALDNARLFERAQTEVRQRAHAALHDLLTGLPNRTLLLNRLTELVEASSDGAADDAFPAGERTRDERAADGSAAARGGGGRIGMILLDIDRFKVVNESLGHAAGDALLVEVARRLARAARRSDTVARLGSDEFGILLVPLRSTREAERVAARIERIFAKPFDLDGREVAVGASLGLAVGRTRGTQAADVLKQAEIALHRAKADPVRSVVTFDPEMSAETMDRAILEHDLRRAIERAELRLYYQPLVDLRSGAIVGLEALLRWQHPERGIVPPLSFIPLAEETGLILPIGRWVLRTACDQVRGWQRRHPSAGPLFVSVNLSAREFARADLVQDVAAILDATGLDPATLELEITESVVMDQSEASVERLRGLRALGVRLVLDDFGTGYSSLSYLRRLPLDTIKIDQSFVAGLGSDDANLPIVQAIIGLAHGLGIDVVAEGIETAEQLAWLRQLGCDRGQGYLYARPLPAAELEALLAASPGDRVVLPALDA